jgi:uncharacterized protein YllA (UPF0747 family)
VKLREEEFYEQYHQHGGTTIIPTEIFNELYDDATEEIERLNNDIKELLKENSNKEKVIIAQDNIINEFDKWLLGEQMMFYKGSDDERLIRFSETKNKWLELKGVDKE